MNDDHPRAFPWTRMGLVAAMVVAASVVAGVMLAGQGVGEEQPMPSSIFVPAPDLLPLEKQRQVTLLVQVRDDEGLAVSNTLLAAGGDTGFVSELQIPADLLLPLDPPSRIRHTGGPTEPGRAQDGLETLLGVQVDATVDIARLAWDGLVDSASSAAVDVNSSAPDAVGVALADVIAHLPADEEHIGQQLTSLGSMARTSVPNSDASHLLAVLRAALLSTPVRAEPLPTVAVRAGSSTVSLADQPEAESVVHSLFPKARLQPGHAGPTRVVLDRAGAPLGAVASARLALVDAGFGVVQSNVASTPTSLVYVPEATDAAKQAGLAVARELGLPASVVRVDSEPGAAVDVRVVLGSDFALV